MAKVHWLAGTLRMDSDLTTAKDLLARARELNAEVDDDRFASDLALSEGGASLTSASFENAIDDFTRSEESRSERATGCGAPPHCHAGR